jgi:glycosyltransferase involved in cell wall biosynthesis
MTFSIIIACYNLGELVYKAIESCICQKGVDPSEYEIIAINDGSKDNTLEYIQRYADTPNLRIIDKPNGGLSQTRNVGVIEAKGEYVLFLDGDDWLDEYALSLLNEHVHDYDIIAFPMVLYFSEDETRVNLQGLKEGVYTRDEMLSCTLGKGEFSIIPAPAKAYRRSFLLENNICFFEGILHEDNPFFIEVMNFCERLYFTEKPLYYYRQNREGSITYCHTFKKYTGVIEGINHIEKLNIESNPSVRFLNANMLVFQVTQNYKNNEENQVFKDLRTIRYKAKMIKYLLTETFDIKHTIRLLLLIIDPFILKLIYRSHER